MFYHRLVQKNELTRQMEDRVKVEAKNYSDTERQFYLGAKNYMLKNYGPDVRYFNLAEVQQNEVMTKLFQAFDTLESSEDMKVQIQAIVNKRLEDLKKMHMNVNKWEMNYNIFENLVERRAQNNHDLYRVFFLRHLTQHMRELVWKGILYDPIKAKEYEQNIKTEKIFTVSKDDLFIISNCQSVLRKNFHPLGDENYEQLMLFKQLMIYMQAFLRKTVLPENNYYLMIPILSAFRNFATKSREKYLASFYVTFIQQVYNQVVPKFNDRDEREYEHYIQNIISSLLQFVHEVDQEIGQKVGQMLEFEDEEINSFYMDLMLNVRRGDITHIPNADLNLTKQQIIFGELLRSFIERMSVSFINIKCTYILWDFILIKVVKQPSDLIVAFSLILFHFKTDLFRCRNIVQVVNMFKQKALLLHEYDFYVLFFNYFKEKDLQAQFDPPEVAQNRQNFPHLQDVIADNLKKKIAKSDPFEQKQQPFKQFTQNMNQFDDSKSIGGKSIADSQKSKILEPDEQKRMLANRLIGNRDLSQLEKDMLKSYY